MSSQIVNVEWKSKNFWQNKVSEIRVSEIRGSKIRGSEIRVSEIRISSNHRELHGAFFFPVSFPTEISPAGWCRPPRRSPQCWSVIWLRTVSGRNGLAWFRCTSHQGLGTAVLYQWCPAGPGSLQGYEEHRSVPWGWQRSGKHGPDSLVSHSARVCRTVGWGWDTRGCILMRRVRLQISVGMDQYVCTYQVKS